MKKKIIFTLLIFTLAITNITYANTDIKLKGDNKQVKINYITLLERAEKYSEILNKEKSKVKVYETNIKDKKNKLKITIPKILTTKLNQQTLWKIKVKNITENKLKFNSDTFNLKNHKIDMIVTNKKIKDIENLEAKKEFIIYVFTNKVSNLKKIKIELMEKIYQFKLE